MQIHYFYTSIKAIGHSKLDKFFYRINNMIIKLLLFFSPMIYGNTIVIHFKYIAQLQRKS